MLGRIFRTVALLQVAFLVACSSLPYQDDLHFMVSAQAGSNEFPVYVNGHLCVDMDGQPGLCAKRLASNKSIDLHFDPQDYGYLLKLTCSSSVTGIQDQNVPAGQPFTYSIKPDQFSSVVQFTCDGVVNPQDRQEPIAARFQVRVVLFDGSYTAREQIRVEHTSGKDYLILGQFARLAWVFDDGAWTMHHKETVVELQGDPAKAKAYSESDLMRFNYYGMTAADGGVDPEVLP